MHLWCRSLERHNKNDARLATSVTYSTSPIQSAASFLWRNFNHTVAFCPPVMPASSQPRHARTEGGFPPNPPRERRGETRGQGPAIAEPCRMKSTVMGEKWSRPTPATRMDLLRTRCAKPPGGRRLQANGLISMHHACWASSPTAPGRMDFGSTAEAGISIGECGVSLDLR